MGKNVNNAIQTGETPLIHVIKYSNTNDKKHLKMLKAIIDSPFIGIQRSRPREEGEEEEINEGSLEQG